MHILENVFLKLNKHNLLWSHGILQFSSYRWWKSSLKCRAPIYCKHIIVNNVVKTLLIFSNTKLKSYISTSSAYIVQERQVCISYIYFELCILMHILWKCVILRCSICYMCIIVHLRSMYIILYWCIWFISLLGHLFCQSFLFLMCAVIFFLIFILLSEYKILLFYF